ncbi:hypothetical protein [Tautonia sociabilis]|uniref:Uncharacterized protein n=1 Tax=Tautonia sociabilis TaxID=2080755 RepID=A0A432MF29_9BACT|nr:hypothetical protein [Tautonia sociabilis]RUL84379.1 hypothetical protein TsocGM_20415 [Tautonia sociabilis]
MSEPPHPDHASDTSRLSPARLLTAVGFVGLVAVILGLLWKVNNTAPAVQNENVELKQQLANMQEMLSDLKRAEQLRMEEEQVRRSDLQATGATAEETAQAVTSFEKAVAAWESTTRELLTTDAGKPLAASTEALGQFQTIWAQPRPDADAPAALRKRLDPLKAVLDKALAANDTSYAPSEDVVARLKAIGDEAKQGAETYDELNRRLAAIVSAAPQAGTEENTPTLQAALEAFERRLTAEETAAIAAAVERERKDRAEKLAREKAESERQITAAQLEAEKIRREAEVRRLADAKGEAMAQAKAEEEVRKAARQRADLERRYQAALPEIQSLLSPFITDGFTQPGRNYFEKATTKKMKVSLGRLQGGGFLEDTPQGVYKLVAAVVPNKANDRPLGSFPQTWSNNYSDPWFAPAQRAQELLRELGPVLVEKGLLEP